MYEVFVGCVSLFICLEGFAIEVLTASWGIPSVHLWEAAYGYCYI